jgi:hypothetical protein
MTKVWDNEVEFFPYTAGVPRALMKGHGTPKLMKRVAVFKGKHV